MKSPNLKINKACFLAVFFIILSFFVFQDIKASCSNVPLGGGYTVSGSCTFSGTVDGADGGGITVNEGTTLTIGAGQTIVWSPNYSLTVNGEIWIDKTDPGTSGQLKKTYIWLTDSDGDGYPTTATPIAQLASTTAAQFRRSDTKFTSKFTYTASTTYDYNDSNASVYPGTACNGDCSENKSDGTCGAKAAGEGGMAACQRCNGTNLTHVDVTNNTQDTEGSNVCNATCKKCSSGSCINQTAGENLFSQCTGAYTCSGYTTRLRNMCNGSGACAAIDASATDCSGTCASYCSSGSCVSTDTSAGTCTVATNARVSSGGDGSCYSGSCSAFPLAGWSHRKSIVIANAGSLQTDYPLKLLVGESSGASGEQVDCNSHVLSSFNDLRFTTSNGSTLIDYWIESKTGTTPNQLATVWIEVPSIAASGNTTIYMYYGNSGAPATSNGTSTFSFFDHFEGASLDTAKWDTATYGAGSGVSVASSILTMTGAGGSYAGAGVVAKSALASGNYAVESYVQWDLNPSEAGYWGTGAGLTDKRVQDTTYYGYWQDLAISNLFTYHDPGTGYYARLFSRYDTGYLWGSSLAIPLWGSNWARITAKIDNTAKKTYGTFIYGGSTYTVDVATAGTTALSSLYPMVHFGYWSGYSAKCDFIAVRKWVSSNEPTWSSFGGEE